MLRFVFSLGLLCLTATHCLAQTLYVTDLLRLSVNEQVKSGGKTVTTLNSGDPITVLERQPGYAKIKTRDGKVGWAKSAYLVTDKPARLIVNEKEQELAEMKERLAQALIDTKSARVEAEKYRKTLQTTEKSSQQQLAHLQSIQQQNQRYASSTKIYARSVPIKIFLITGIILFLIGIWLGWYIMDYRQRKRHGGFRI